MRARARGRSENAVNHEIFMRKRRAIKLTSEVSDSIVQLLDSWKGKLTWQLLIDKVNLDIGVEYSRFTLLEHRSIANAFSVRKRALLGQAIVKNEAEQRQPVNKWVGQIDRLTSKSARLESENRLLKEQFVVWAAHAARKGITVEFLNSALAKPNRDADDDSGSAFKNTGRRNAKRKTDSGEKFVGF